jgi:hypothetical protein
VQDTVDVRPGDTLSVRVPLEESDTGAVHVAQTSFTIPMNATGDGDLEVEPARPDYWLQRGLTLEATIDKLLSQPSSYDLELQIRLRGTHRIKQFLTQDRPLNGWDSVNLNLLKG